MSLEMMIVVGFIVGFLVGGTGIGGIILIPALVYLAGLSSHVAMGTTLFTFIFTTILSSYLYIRLGHVDWKATIPICVGGLLFSYVGAAVKAGMAAPYLNLVLAPAYPVGRRAGLLSRAGAAVRFYGGRAVLAVLDPPRGGQRRGLHRRADRRGRPGPFRAHHDRARLPAARFHRRRAGLFRACGHFRDHRQHPEQCH